MILDSPSNLGPQWKAGARYARFELSSCRRLARLERSVPDLSAGSQSVVVPSTQWKVPWNVAPFGLVTIYDMLRYAAEDFYKLSQDLTQLVNDPMLMTNPQNVEKLQSCMDVLHHHCSKLGLKMSLNQIGTIVDASRRGETVGQISAHIKQLQARVYEELDSKICFCIPQEKVHYWNPTWLLDTPIYDSFRSAWEEFQRAGHCYAFGENTACVFHLMRIVDFGLRQVAKSIGAEYDARNWSGIGKKIQQKMEQKYDTKTDDWKKSEPMYAEILTDIQAISRGHRNPVLHELEKKYEERDAQHMLNVVEGFMLHLAKHGFRETREQTL
jgi:hypothetical protein